MHHFLYSIEIGRLSPLNSFVSHGNYKAMCSVIIKETGKHVDVGLFYLLTDWLAYLYRRIRSPKPDVMPDRREGITRAAGFGFACIDTLAS